MPMHKVKVTQVTRVERSIVMEVEADTIEDAVEMQQEKDAPDSNSSRWTVERLDLENETVEPA